MTIFDFIFTTIVLICITVVIIGWLGLKYDVVGRDKEKQELQEELKKEQEKFERYKKRKSKNNKGGKS